MEKDGEPADFKKYITLAYSRKWRSMFDFGVKGSHFLEAVVQSQAV
jgi:hypothetical protein